MKLRLKQNPDIVLVKTGYGSDGFKTRYELSIPKQYNVHSGFSFDDVMKIGRKHCITNERVGHLIENIKESDFVEFIPKKELETNYKNNELKNKTSWQKILIIEQLEYEIKWLENRTLQQRILNIPYHGEFEEFLIKQKEKA